MVYFYEYKPLGCTKMLCNHKASSSVSHHQQPRCTGSSWAAPRWWSPTTGPASHPAPKSFSCSSASRRPTSRYPGSMLKGRECRGLYYYSPLRPRGRCHSWKGAHVCEPLVSQLILNGKHLTALLWRKTSDQRPPGSDQRGSALHEAAGKLLGSTGKQRQQIISPLTVPLHLCVRTLYACVKSDVPTVTARRSPSLLGDSLPQHRKTVDFAFKIKALIGSDVYFVAEEVRWLLVQSVIFLITNSLGAFSLLMLFVRVIPWLLQHSKEGRSVAERSSKYIMYKCLLRLIASHSDSLEGQREVICSNKWDQANQ